MVAGGIHVSSGDGVSLALSTIHLVLRALRQLACTVCLNEVDEPSDS